MSVLNRIAYFQNRRDEVPNQQLARALAEKKDKKGIREIAAHLGDENAALQSDCLKVLYEVGYLDPSLIADYAGDFLKLLKHKNNRLIWGSMIAILAIIASKKESYRRKIFPYLIKHLETCRPKEAPQHAEKSLIAINAKNKAQFIHVLEKRMTDMTRSGAARLKRVIQEAERR